MLLEALENEARGKSSRNFRRPSYTLAELGLAAGHVPQLYFWAACYAFAGARSYLNRLHIALTREATNLQHDSGWPDSVRDIHGLKRPYLPWLAKLILDEDFCPNQFHVCRPL
jgi:hypothetical protein